MAPALNQFVATAVAEKIAAFFEERATRGRAAAERGKPSALLAALSRPGGEPPRQGDELPAGWVPPEPRATPPRKRVTAKPAAAPRRAATGKQA